ncbi:MAG: RNA polymerase sigma factor [Myxococcales bacterium]|nr:MAG: RNA polymerase sigma factor [Myxococcales bacterium]
MAAIVGAPSLTGAGGADSRAEPRPSFVEVYESTAEYVWRTVGHLGVAEAAVEDVVQEVFLVVHRRLAEFEGRSSVRTWVYGIAVHVARSHRRAVGRRPPPAAASPLGDPDVLGDDPRQGPDALLERAQAALLVDELLDQLDADLREVFVLAELEEMTATEIGDVLGLNPNTVSSRLRLARRDFNRALGRARARDEWRIR